MDGERGGMGPDCREREKKTGTSGREEAALARLKSGQENV